METIGLLK